MLKNKKSISFLNSFLITCKDFAITYYFGTFHLPGYDQWKWYYRVVENFDIYFQAKKSYLSLTFLKHHKNIANLLFWIIWTQLAMPNKTIALTFRKLWRLSRNKKSTWSIILFYRYYTLKNATIWLVKNILGNNSRKRFLPDMVFVMESQ